MEALFRVRHDESPHVECAGEFMATGLRDNSARKLLMNTMKKLAFRNSVAPAAVCAGLCLAGGAVESQAQLTPGQKRLILNEVNGFLGGRAEVGIVLGASDSASGGNYTVDGRRGNSDLDYSLAKFSGGGEIGEPRKLGDSSITWNPVVMGSISSFHGKNDVDSPTSLFRGNKLEESTFGLDVGGGMALHLTDRWTVTPTIGMIYGHYDPHIIAHTANGLALKRNLDGSADALGASPGIGVAYKLPMGKNMWEFSAHYTFYGTEDISDSDFDIGGSSHVFEQRADLDIPLPAELFDCQLHTGGYVSLTEVAGDISDSMSSDVWATVHGRLLLNTLGKSWAWKMDRIGIGMSGIFADHFTGWDAGVEVTFKF